MWLELLLRNHKHAFLAVYYQPPALNIDKKLKFIDSFESCLDKIISIKPLAIILTGDFNDNSTNISNSANHLSLLFKAYQNYNFSQLICEPTRRNKTRDWIVTDEPNKAVSSSVFPPIGNFDHHVTFARFSLYHSIKPMHKTPYWDFSRVNFDDINSVFFDALWNDGFMTAYNINQAAEFITNSTLFTLYLRSFETSFK